VSLRTTPRRKINNKVRERVLLVSSRVADGLAGAAVASLGSVYSSKLIMAPRTEANVRKVAETDLALGLICADRDGNRIRIDRINTDGEAQTISYHFLNDELRVQEGIQEPSIEQFLAEGWYIAGPGKSL
jgi:hypothetical protein